MLFSYSENIFLTKIMFSSTKESFVIFYIIRNNILLLMVQPISKNNMTVYLYIIRNNILLLMVQPISKNNMTVYQIGKYNRICCIDSMFAELHMLQTVIQYVCTYTQT